MLVVDAVKAWLDLQWSASWLLTYDNYDNPRISKESDSSSLDIRQYLPGSHQGSIIITTRSARVTQGHRFNILKLTELEDGLRILENMSRRKDVRDSKSQEC